MANVPAFLNPSSFGSFDPYKNTDVEAIPAVNAANYDDPTLSVSATLVNTQPVSEIGRTVDVFVMDSFDTDYYNTIWIVPNPVDLGYVIDGQTVEVFVWNAYFIPQMLVDMAPSNAEGLSLTESHALPTEFMALEYRFYKLVASLDGPPTIDAAFVFYFPSDTPILRVIGFRTILFPFRPNWKRNLIERLEWLTDVITHYDGTEQRRSLRKFPRRVVEYELIAQGGKLQKLRSLLWSWQARSVALPIWYDSAALTQSVASGDKVLYVSRIAGEFEIGKQVVLLVDDNVNEIVTLAEINSDNIVTASPLLYGFAKGTRIYPVKGGRFVEQKKTVRHTPTVESVILQFLIEDAGNVEAIDSAAQYRGFSVLETDPNWGRDVTDEYQQKMQIIDVLTNAPVYDIESEVATVFQQMGWTLATSAQIQALKSWFFARRGQLVPTWVPTWSDDLTLALPFNAPDTELYIKDIGYRQFYGQIGRRDIRIKLKSGEIYYRRVSSPQKQAGGMEKISIDSEIGRHVDPKDVAMISFMALCRLNSDAVETAYHTPEVAETTVTMKSVQYDV